MHGQEFVIRGNVNLPDGYIVGVSCRTDTSFSVSMADGVIKGGRFELRGHMDKPQPGTLMTNNLELVEKNGWPVDSIRWTYTDVFLANEDITVTSSVADVDGKLSVVMNVSGGEVMNDFMEWTRTKQAAGAEDDSDSMRQCTLTFIDKHPSSVISLYLANNMMQRGYRLTSECVEHLASTLQPNALDPSRWEEFKKRIVYARKTTVGSSLVDIKVEDVDGKVSMLSEHIERGRYVLVDFWASWCGMCLYAMPEVKEILQDYKDVFTVVGLSIDQKRDAWTKAMQKHVYPWKQLLTTPEGYKTVFEQYQLGNGVPYYLLLDKEGRAVLAPNHPYEIREYLERHISKHKILNSEGM